MAKRGDVIELAGTRLEILTAAAESGGELLAMEATYAAGRAAPPLHQHPFQEERFTCIRGAVRAIVEGRENELRAGEELVVPAGVDHTFWNPSDDEAVVRWEVRPALGTERMWEELAAAGPTPAAGDVLRRYSDEFRLAASPQFS